MTSFQFKNSFAESIFRQKYAQGNNDSWPDLCRRLVNDVCGDRSLSAKPNESELMSKEDQAQLVQYMIDMKFIAGGRYLAFAGRSVSFWNNCFCLKAEEDTREEWARLAGVSTSCLMSGGGIGVDYSILRPSGRALSRTGGTSCLTGDTIVYKDRKKSSQENVYRISDLWELQRKRPDVIPLISLRCMDEETGLITKNKLVEVLDKGYSDVYEITTRAGYKIKATMKHRFLNQNFDWWRLEEFKEGDYIAVNGKEFKQCVDCGKPIDRKAKSRCITCHNINQKSNTALHTTMRQRKECIDYRLDFCEICSQKNTRFEVHHIDRNPNNNNHSNLLNLCSGCHRKLHAKEDSFGISYKHKWVTMDVIKTIIHVGVEQVYDLSMQAPNHNFIANGFVSHNSGPIPLMHIINEIGRNVMQGGSRRSAIYGSLNWQHDDIQDFLTTKDWDEHTRKHKARDFNFPAPLDMTNISINWDTSFADKCIIGEDEQGMFYPKGDGEVPKLWYDSVLKMCQTGEPGHAYNFWENENDTLRNAPVTGGTRILTDEGYVPVKEVIGKTITVWTGNRWANTVFKQTRESSPLVRVSLSNGRNIVCSPDHPFIVKESNYKRYQEKFHYTARIEAERLCPGARIKSDLPTDDWSYSEPCAELYGQGFIFGDGSVRNQRLDISYFVPEKKVCFDRTVYGLNMKLGSSGTRAYGRIVFECKNDMIENGNHNNPSFIAGWFDADGSYTRDLLRISNKDKDTLLTLSEALDLLGIRSVVREDGKSSYKPENSMYTLQILTDSFNRFKEIIPTLRIKLNVGEQYKPYRGHNIKVTNVERLDYEMAVYCCDVGVEEHSFMAEGVCVSNCCEFTSEDDSDVCNLGSINLGNITSLDELRDVVCLASKFLVCGTLRAELPYDKVRQVREQNRKIGLGLMGVHEWLLQRGYKYEVVDEIKGWLQVYKKESEKAANEHCDRFYLNRPKKYRAIAPAGTIGILASTSTGIECLYAVAYKRRYLESGTRWKYQYIIDSTAQRIIDETGINPQEIETSASLATNPEQRIRFQYEIQKYVDMAISSTINLPEWGSKFNNESTSKELADTLLQYCHGLRGITVYPNGSRGGQPLTEVPYEDAKKHHGMVFAEENTCSGGICSI